MNWTGGRLSRHSRGGVTSTLNQQQKAHFAKVQNNLRDGTKKQSPIKWSIFGKFHVKQPEREQQRSLEPLAFSREASQPVPHGTPPYTENGGQIVRDRHQFQSHEYQHTRQPTPGPAKQERVREDNLYSATPQPLQKRKREETVSKSGLYELDNIDFISKKRKKLLEKGDWVGISYQRPLRMTFASPKHADNVGRRRKVTDGHQVQYTNRPSTLISPFINRAPPSFPQIFEPRNQRGKTDVRIHIGNKVVPPGISSSTAPGRRRRGHSMHEQKRDRSLVANSDVMLLDIEDVLAVASSCVVDETPFEDQQADAFRSDVYYESQLCPGRHAQARRDHELSADEQFDDGTVGGHFGDDSTQYYHNLSSTEVDAESSVYVSQHSISPILGTPFSPTLIKHPIPQSSRVSSILYSSSSEIPNSTVAQVGKVNPVVPSSQVLDNELWEKWMATLYNEKSTRSQHEHDSESIEQETTISPGISTAPARRFSHPAPKRHQKNNAEVDDEQFGDIDKASRMVNPSTQGSSANEDYFESRDPPRKPLRREPEGRSRIGRAQEPAGATESLKRRCLEKSTIVASVKPVAKRRMSNIAFPSATLRPENPPISHPKPTAKPQKGDDPDDLWRKFVFDSDEMNESQRLSQPKAALGLVRHDGIVCQ